MCLSAVHNLHRYSAVYELATQQIRDIDSIMEDRYRLPDNYDDDMAGTPPSPDPTFPDPPSS
jgi:hypothetical protein